MNCTYDILRCVASHKARGIYIYNSLHAPYVPSMPSTYCVHVGASIGLLISNAETNHCPVQQTQAQHKQAETNCWCKHVGASSDLLISNESGKSLSCSTNIARSQHVQHLTPRLPPHTTHTTHPRSQPLPPTQLRESHVVWWVT